VALLEGGAALQDDAGPQRALPQGRACRVTRKIRCLPLSLLASVVFLGSARAARWVDVGSTGVTLDKVMVDLDSVRKVDNFRTADLMTVYAAPRENLHHITLDRHVQKTAFECTDHTYALIRTFGFLGDKPVGSSPEDPDWRTKLKPMGDNPLNRRTFDAVCGAPLTDGAPAAARPKSGSGSGIVVDDSGDILTAAHVVQHCKTLTVKTPESKALEATVEAVDPKNDLALLRIAYAAPLGEPAHFRSTAAPAKLGESVGVIGYPLTGLLSSEPKATYGQVNSVAGVNNDYTLLQISAPIQPGNSGGPVLDNAGQVIGVVVSEAAPLVIAAMSGTLPQNVNFAVRGEVAQIFLSARGIRVLSIGHPHPLTTEAIAATGLKSTVLVQCLNE
jgi:S1-C subfamily serine protease